MILETDILVLSLQNMYLGGVPSLDLVSLYVPIRTGFKGCIQKVREMDTLHY